MEAIRKQASKLREQVARQQQAVMKQFGGGYGADGAFADEAEAQQHSKLEKLYISTRAAKHFQRDIVRGVEGYIVTGSKQVEIGNKLCEDGKKYGTENTCTSGSTLSKAALSFAKARSMMEKERSNLLKALGTQTKLCVSNVNYHQVAEPLRAMVMGAPLEDARHLAQRYDRMRQEAETQAIEVSKRQMKLREASGNGDMISRLEAAETKLQELKSSMGVLGKEAVAAMTTVEAQQQRLTLQRLIALVESERNYHQRVLQILDQLEREMVSERQRIEGAPPPVVESSMPPPPAYEEVNGIFMRNTVAELVETVEYLAEAIQSYRAESDTELNLAAGDYIVVRKVSNNGWAEGECRGKAGWFPYDYIEKRERVLAKGSFGSLPRGAFHYVQKLHAALLLLSPAYPSANSPSIMAAAAAAAVTLLRLPLARLNYHLHSVPPPRIPPPRLRISTSYRFLYSLGHGSASAAVAEAVAAPDAEGDLVDAEEESHEEESTAEAEAEAPRSFVLPRLPRPKLSVKERKELASYAHGLGKKLKSQQVGKGGVTPNLVSAFSDNLESNELLKLKIHGNCPGELTDVILQLEESTGSIAVDQIGRSVILYRPSTSKMKKRQEVAENARRFARSKEENARRFAKSEESFEERPRNSTGRRFVKSGSTFSSQQKRRPMASKGSSYGRG
ncbi:SH3 domain-containing protein 2-like isoform X2 [Panicum miliaceum]|uniref:SH3 domain-containing protein 2-like isoform X2 n=1 Tax=Panicum miliaceum TaxID=4540 RepID=A0A3L6SDC6_PANMI|nr:SH3 domain-containing protein 2-like isoform X2 [Panicum miliaceum]